MTASIHRNETVPPALAVLQAQVAEQGGEEEPTWLHAQGRVPTLPVALGAGQVTHHDGLVREARRLRRREVAVVLRDGDALREVVRVAMNASVRGIEAEPATADAPDVAAIVGVARAHPRDRGRARTPAREHRPTPEAGAGRAPTPTLAHRTEDAPARGGVQEAAHALTAMTDIANVLGIAGLGATPVNVSVDSVKSVRTTHAHPAMATPETRTRTGTIIANVVARARGAAHARVARNTTNAEMTSTVVYPGHPRHPHYHRRIVPLNRSPLVNAM